MATGGCTYPSTKERSNYTRLCRTIVDLGTDVLRDTLSNKLVVPSQLHLVIRNCVDLKTKPLNAEERQKINNAVTNSSFGEFDITFLYKLIRAISVQDLRHKLSSNIPASRIWTIVQNDRSIKAQLSKEQEAKIKFSSSHGDYSECDCYLLTLLLSKLTSVSIPNIIPSANKWGDSCLPKSTDVNLGDDIERIRFLRNKVYGHVNDTCVTDAEFQSHWATLSGIMHRMDQNLNTGGCYLTDLNDIESASLDENWGYYESEIERLAKYEQELEVRLGKQEKSVESLQTNVSLLSKHEKEIRVRLENQEDSIQQLQKDSVCIHKRYEETKVVLEKQIISTEQLQTDVASLNTSENETKLLLQKQDESTERIQADLASLTTSETEIKCKLENYEVSTLKIGTDVESLYRGVADIGRQVGELRLDIDKQQQSHTEIQEQVTVHGIHIAQLSQDKDNSVPLNIQEQNKMVVDLWTEEDIVFIETRATKKALDLIDKNNILSVIGNAGTGKSATIHHIALHLKSKGYDILEIHSPSEIKSYLNPDSKQVFVIDDPVGFHSLDYERLGAWNRYDNRLRLCLSKGDHKLLCSIRKQVANEPDFEKDKTILNEININLQDEACFLTDEEKIKMLQQHLKKNKYGEHNQILRKIKRVLKDTLDHFPLICKLFSSKKEFQKYGLEFFKQPFSIILEDLTAMKRGVNRKYCILVMCFVNKNHLDLNDFDVFNSKGIDEKFKSVVKACALNENEFCGTLRDNVISLSGVYLKQEGRIFKFNHDLIHDVVAFNFGQQYPKQMIEFSPSRFLCERVSLDDNVVSQDPYILILDSEYYDLFLQRLVNDLEDGEEYDFVAKNKCWDNKIFMNVFCKEFKKHKDKICNLFCKKVKQSKEYVDKVNSEIEVLEERDLSQLWSRHIYILTMRLVDDIALLHLMIMYAHIDFFTLIWKKLSLEDRKNINCKIPLLHYACLGGDTDICDIILRDTECSVNSVFHCEQTIFTVPIDFLALHLASLNNTAIIKYLLSRGSNINAVIERTFVLGRTAIAVASGSGDIDNVSLLIKEGADINNEGCPLVFAAVNNHVNIVQLLLRHYANVDIQDKVGWTALMSASRYGHNEIVQLLLNHTASVDMQDNVGWTALMQASCYGHNEIVQLLLNHTASVDMQDKEGRTALMMASLRGQNEIVQLLLIPRANVDTKNNNSHKASVDMPDDEGLTALMKASHEGHSEIVQLLLSHKASVDMHNNEGVTALIMASRYGYNEIVQLLLNHKASVDMQNNEGVTALMFASLHGHNEIVQLLLSHKASVDMQNNEGWTALMMASRYGHNKLVTILQASVDTRNDKGVTNLMSASCNGYNEIIQLLLSHKASVDMQENDGWTALIMASSYGYNEIVQLLLSHKASVDMQNNEGVTALMFTSLHGHNDIVQLLLSHKASVDMQDNKGWTALMFASCNGHNEIVQLLLSHKASVDMQDNEGWTALMMASRNSHNAIVQVLLSHKASVDIQNDKGVSALMFASFNGHNEIVQLLLNQEASVDMQDNRGGTSLMAASHEGHNEIVQLLLSHKSSVDMQHNEGVTALMLASRYGHNEIAQLLLSHKASVDMQDNAGVTALMGASGHGHNEIVQLLLSHKASVDMQDNEGWTALMIASRYDHNKIVQLLLSHKASVDMQHNEGWTALMLVSRYGHNEIAQLLLSHKANVDMHYNGVTALMFSSCNGYNEIVQLLLSHNASVDTQDNKGWTALMLASFVGHGEIVKLLLSNKASVNIQSIDGWTAIKLASHNHHNYIIAQFLTQQSNTS